MQYALVNNVRSLPEKGTSGTCIGCHEEVISKCGNIKVHHWAHKRKDDCDTWSEPETQWHREWKNKFPESYREVVFRDDNTLEFHRADVHTSGGVTIEFQNSPLSVEEFNQRNTFYKKLIWVVNGIKFKDNFTLDHEIPHPDDPLMNDFEILGKAYFKKDEIVELGVPAPRLLRVYGLHDPELNGLALSNNHYAFTWKNKHKTWFESPAVIFLDFGDDFLYRLMKKEQSVGLLWYLKIVNKSDFIQKYSQ